MSGKIKLWCMIQGDVFSIQIKPIGSVFLLKNAIVMARPSFNNAEPATLWLSKVELYISNGADLNTYQLVLVSDCVDPYHAWRPLWIGAIDVYFKHLEGIASRSCSQYYLATPSWQWVW